MATQKKIQETVTINKQSNQIMINIKVEKGHAKTTHFSNNVKGLSQLDIFHTIFCLFHYPISENQWNKERKQIEKRINDTDLERLRDINKGSNGSKQIL